MPLPLFFRLATPTAKPEGEGLQGTPSLSHRLSTQRRRKEASASRDLKYSDLSMGSRFGEGGVALDELSMKEKRE